MESILLNCLPRPIEINLKKDDYCYQLHADGIVSLDIDFKMQLGNRVF